MRRGATVEQVLGPFSKILDALVAKKQGEIILTSVIPVAEKYPQINARVAAANTELARLAAERRIHWVDLARPSAGADTWPINIRSTGFTATARASRR